MSLIIYSIEKLTVTAIRIQGGVCVCVRGGRGGDGGVEVVIKLIKL